MKRITLWICEEPIYLYVDGDCDQVELGRLGESPMQRRSAISIVLDDAHARTELRIAVEEITEL